MTLNSEVKFKLNLALGFQKWDEEFGMGELSLQHLEV